MKKKILLLAMLPAYSAFAQSHPEYEDLNRQPAPSALATEIKTRESKFNVFTGSGKEIDAPLAVSSIEEQQMLKESFDYFPAEDVLHNRINHPGVPHKVSSTRFVNVSLNLEGIVYDHLDCYVIHDQYNIKAGKELPGDYRYNNTYFLYQDKTGATLATVIYVESAIGSIKAENRIVRKGLSALDDNALTIAPNPAHSNITFRYKIAVPGHYTLNVTTLEGKTVATLLDKKIQDTGTQTMSSTLNLAAGTYMVVLSSDHTTPVTQKLIIQ